MILEGDSFNKIQPRITASENMPNYINKRLSSIIARNQGLQYRFSDENFQNKGGVIYKNLKKKVKKVSGFVSMSIKALYS